ncbi:L-aspartate oxidase [Cryobacterium psychrophilum]|uniref:L-aspartate oxidase n=1 Tax=Cryobacterium psychrophilum TaxID=41988 RepID=A0A4Y8KWC2_9MICO|nr:L-aspartate oxidase [Cryobacterium psychrophilum]TDW30941.1 L-aspartate oxidase [Cryobacterium psychrophilum]TFD80811.1 L-aspartate oxidase [Cryobacterium psychrophilum]
MASVIVIGSGLAGLTAAVRATDAGHRVTLVTKAALDESNTKYAQGGIAAALFPDDSVEAHVLDTLRAGAGLCDEDAVQVLCTEGPARVRDLIRFGVDFDRDESGISRGLEAAHSRSRVLHSGGDATGAAIQAALVATIRQRAAANSLHSTTGIQILEHTMLIELSMSSGRVVGVRLLGPDAQVQSIRADAVILATGGAGTLFRHTTNPSVATGDGVAAAWRAGASVADLEFYQFHPTALAVAGSPLVSEAVRGEGAVLRNRRGERFMLDIPGEELAARDVVARAIAREMAEQDGEPVLLDATGLGRDLLESRFPTITAACRAVGLDWALDPIPVAPAAHYWMGGVVTDAWGRTTLPGLFAVGEVARTGAHGANRLASNSLLEAAVFADRAVRALSVSFEAASFDVSSPVEHVGEVAPLTARPVSGATARTAAAAEKIGATSTPAFSREALQHVMWDSAGVHRSGAGLERAAATLTAWSTGDLTDRADVRQLENRNLLDLARLAVAAALARTESRGAHHRADFPHTRTDLAWSRSWTAHRPSSMRTAHTVAPHVPDTAAREAIAC